MRVDAVRDEPDAEAKDVAHMTASNPPPGNQDGGEPAHDAIVLGAGMSGLVSASILLDQGSGRVVVIDEYDHVGGNHIDRTTGGYTFDVGSFIFQDDSPLLKHFPELLPLYVPIVPTWGKLNPQGVITRYPFSVRDDFLAAGPAECLWMLLSAATARLRRRRQRTAKDFAQYWIGSRLLHRSGLANYMARFCGLPPEQIDIVFARKRMLWISEHASVRNVLRSVLRPPTDQGAPVNRQLVRPREGFTTLYSPAVRHLENDGVTFSLGVAPRRIRRDDTGTFHVDVGDRQFSATRLVSTIPVDRACELAGMSRAPLPTVTLISLFFSFTGERGFEQPILYNFDHTGAWKRLTVYSDFYGPHDGREFFAVEVIAGQVRESVEEAEADFRRHVSANRLFAGDLRLEGTHTLHNAYPIYTGGAATRAGESIAALRELGVESFGRQGAFEYQPTARVSTVQAEEALRPA